MTPPMNVPRKLRQLDNDVQEIYKSLASISATQQQHGTRLDTIETRLEGMDTRLGTMDTRLEGVETRLEGVETRLEGVETGLGGVETRLGGIDTKLDVIVEAMGLDVPDDHYATGLDE